MLSLTSRFELLRRSSRLAPATVCAGHRFDDAPQEGRGRLATGWLVCVHCGVRVPVLVAFFYEQGVRHGTAAPAREQGE